MYPICPPPVKPRCFGPSDVVASAAATLDSPPKSLSTSKGPGEAPYPGRVADRPIADFNYEITTYTFTEPGVHTIQWKGGGASAQGSLGLVSNIIKLEVVKQ